MQGEVINGRYRVIDQLGSGGMGAVFQAEDTKTGKRVALKVIATGDATKDKALVGRFQREAKAASSIDTDHIVRVLETGTDPTSGRPFMAMELLEGEDLQQVFRRLGQLSPEVALRLMAQACAGLQRAHEAKVIHRDIKPANIFLARGSGDERIVKLLDFGIAKIKTEQALANDTTGLTRTGSMVGSPAYMSPEQARGAKTIDHRADLWSLGIVFYQALCGDTPYSDIDALGELIIAICSELPRPIQDRAPWVPPEMATIIHRALRLDPKERYQTADEMFAAMRALSPDLTIRETMVVSVEADVRAAVADKIKIAPLSRPFERNASSAPPHHSTSTKDGLAVAQTDESVGADPFTSRPPSHATPTPEGSSKALLFIAGGALILAAGAAALVYKLASVVPPAAPIAATESALTATATVTATASAAAPAPARWVKVVILPEDATIEVDGAPATAKAGVLDISGALGSVHRVHVSKGGKDTTIEVVVSDSGALPPKIEIEQAKAAKAGPRGVVAPAQAAVDAPKSDPAPAPPPPQPTQAPGLKEKFE